MAEYPVLVTETVHYVVWVDAADAADAHQAIEDTPYEWVEGEKPVDASFSVESDPAETARYIWLYGANFTPPHDAHVQAHQSELARRNREARYAACEAAGHPERETNTEGPVWCEGCRSYLPETAVAR